ncbi:hypothetical protein IPZ61_08390 [Streptomyces sioyaensis]|uniref:hypothetical protein n=1 Tax=Streptomyces sioyaensis TaxID=67364 RepID=UPI001F194338|nr:hypothetical protein [Streptomyces sioyaensis]MCF3173333.1 hypothetical protein [Streptomyces sioyaensis]
MRNAYDYRDFGAGEAAAVPPRSRAIRRSESAYILLVMEDGVAYKVPEGSLLRW